jgi:hypothetical protein
MQAAEEYSLVGALQLGLIPVNLEVAEPLVGLVVEHLAVDKRIP